jgi:hypothetical protein
VYHRPTAPGRVQADRANVTTTHQRGQHIDDVTGTEQDGRLGLPAIHQQQPRKLVRDAESFHEVVKARPLRHLDTDGSLVPAGRSVVGEVREKVDLDLHGAGGARRRQAP